MDIAQVNCLWNTPCGAILVIVLIPLVALLFLYRAQRREQRGKEGWLSAEVERRLKKLQGKKSQTPKTRISGWRRSFWVRLTEPSLRSFFTILGVWMTLLASGLLLLACDNFSESIPPDGDLDVDQVEDGDVKDTDVADGDIDSGRCPDGMAWDAVRQQCLPLADGDLDYDADNGGDADTIDGDQDAEPDSFTVTKSFSHNMDADDPLLLPGEIRVTAGESGVNAPFVQYSIHNHNIFYCSRNKNSVLCNVANAKCDVISIANTDGLCFYPNIGNEFLSAIYFQTLNNDTIEPVVILIDYVNLKQKTINEIAYYLSANEQYLAWRDNGKSLILYQWENQEKQTLFKDDLLAPSGISISLSDLIWVTRSKNGAINPHEIYVMDLNNMQKKSIAHSETERLCDSEISYQGAVWIEDCLALDDPAADGRLIYYNLQSETKSEIDPQPHPKDNPAIDGTKIVWTDFRNGGITSSSNYQNADIYLHDLSKNQTIPISTAPGNQFWPRISGRYVIYEDTRWNRTPHDIVLFDLCSLEMYADDAMCRN